MHIHKIGLHANLSSRASCVILSWPLAMWPVLSLHCRQHITTFNNLPGKSSRKFLTENGGNVQSSTIENNLFTPAYLPWNSFLSFIGYFQACMVVSQCCFPKLFRNVTVAWLQRLLQQWLIPWYGWHLICWTVWAQKWILPVHTRTPPQAKVSMYTDQTLWMYAITDMHTQSYYQISNTQHAHYAML